MPSVVCSAQLADQADMALENLRLIDERKAHETRDPLTGLYNFRYLREHAGFELERARRYGRKVAFAMLDLDDFQRVNDEVGREGGDEVLCHWAAALAAQLRSCDLVCRYGADEFLLVLPETADQQADAALERSSPPCASCRRGRRAARTRSPRRPASRPTPTTGRTREELVAKAATTMYTARAGGPGRSASTRTPRARRRAEPAARVVGCAARGAAHRHPRRRRASAAT